jgi:hypothetical protein
MTLRGEWFWVIFIIHGGQKLFGWYGEPGMEG